MTTNSKREANFELMRIVGILLVITLHFLTNSDLSAHINLNSANGVIFTFLKSLCCVCDNLFVLLTGYFSVKSSFKLGKVINLWAQVFFYSVFIYVILVLCGKIEFSVLGLYKAATPVFSKQYWFFSCYIGLYLIFPLLNILINNMSRKLHFTAVITGFVLFSALDSLLITEDPFYIGGGKSIVWFAYLYIAAAYVRLYVPESDKKYRYIGYWLAFTAITTAYYYLMGRLGAQQYANKLISFLSVTVTLSSFSLFMFFRNIKIKNAAVSRVLIALSPLTFGVYLIHDNCNLSRFLWTFVNPSKYAESLKLWLLLIAAVPAVYAVCAVIEFLRAELFSLFYKIKSKKD